MASYLSNIQDFNWRCQIVQVDLVINWKQFREDNICRHLRIVNRSGDVEWVDIINITPVILPQRLYCGMSLPPKRLRLAPMILFNKKQIMFRAENEILMLSVKKPDYAINK